MTGRGGLRLWILAATVLGAGAALYTLAFPDPTTAIVAPMVAQPAAPGATPAEAPPDASPPPSPAFEVTAVIGVVEVGAGDRWRPIGEGERLYPGETIRTNADGHALLRTAGGDELTLRERVTLEVTTLSRTLTELTLTRGKVRAAPAPSTERFAISAGTATAVGGGGSRFTVYTDGQGAAVVASDVGDVQVVGGGGQVKVGPRQQTVAEKGQRPRDPIPIPDEVFLSVTWPEGKVMGTRAVVHGVAAPGTEVRVNGAPATVGADGYFAAPVTLREGANRVEVHAEDMSGRERTVRRTVNARTVGPPLDADTKRLYEEPEH